MADYTINFSIPDEHVPRIRYALIKQFGQIAEEVTEEVTDPVTNEVTTVTNTIMRDPTSEENLERVRTMAINNIKAIVMSVEAEEAAAAARAAISSIIIE